MYTHQDANGKFRRKTLVDGGCEEIVMSKECAQKIDLKGEKTNLKAETWDGTLVKMDFSSENLELFIGQAKFNIVRTSWIGFLMTLFWEDIG